MNNLRLVLRTLIFLFLIRSNNCIAQIKLPKLISDGMVLQREKPIKIWGWAIPDETITVAINNQTLTGQTQADSIWTISLPPQKAGGPYQIRIKGSSSKEILVNEVLFGDVWICSGQSNMELNLGRLKDKYPEVIKQANNSMIRQFYVPRTYDFKGSRKDFSGGQWIAVNPKNISTFSGVAYFFGHELYEKLKVPIGLINTALGGSPAQSWISEEGLQDFPAYLYEMQLYKNDAYIKTLNQYNQANHEVWMNQLNKTDKGKAAKWHQVASDKSNWPTIVMPKTFKADNPLHKPGVIWLHKTFSLTKAQLGKNNRLFLGRIIDSDSVYVNGQFVGTTGYQYPPRKYDVPPSILKEGTNEVTIRVIDQGGNGGFKADKPYYLIINAQDTVDLSGLWQYKIGAVANPKPGNIFIRWKPGGLYNAMIAPLQKYPVKGCIWYQGESNTNYPDDYAALMTTLINTWRKDWKDATLPFLFVQLANFMESSEQPQESNWAELRQQQLNTLKIPHTGMAVTIDLGEWNDIHPLNKEDVGKRLALLAFEKAYQLPHIKSSGPRVSKYEVSNEKVTLFFDNAGEGFQNKTIHYFELAGADKKFFKAKATVKGKFIEVISPDVKAPKYIRYAWAHNPDGANLYNKEGLPASPFEIELYKH